MQSNLQQLAILGRASSVAMNPRVNFLHERCWFATVLVEGLPVTMLLDTGASCSVVSTSVSMKCNP